MSIQIRNWFRRALVAGVSLALVKEVQIAGKLSRSIPRPKANCLKTKPETGQRDVMRIPRNAPFFTVDGDGSGTKREIFGTLDIRTALDKHYKASALTVNILDNGRVLFAPISI